MGESNSFVGVDRSGKVKAENNHNVNVDVGSTQQMDKENIIHTVCAVNNSLISREFT